MPATKRTRRRRRAGTNLWWIGGLAAYVLLEKALPVGHWLGYVVGVALVGWGVWLVASA